MENIVLDSDLQIITEENRIKWAGFWIRVGASLIDFIVYLPLVGLNLYNLYYIKSLPLQLSIFIILVVYKPFMEFKFGATLGKMAVKIKVVNSDLEKITMSQAIMRYLPWILSQAVSLITTVLLFLDPNFGSAKGMLEVGTLQAGIISQSFSYITSAIMIISCLIVVFNNKKQAGHDMVAGTYCIIK